MKTLMKFSNLIVLIFLLIFTTGSSPSGAIKSKPDVKVKVVKGREPILYFEITYEGITWEFSGRGTTSGNVTTFVGEDDNGTITRSGSVSGTFSSSGPGDYSIDVEVTPSGMTAFPYSGPAAESTTEFF